MTLRSSTDPDLSAIRDLSPVRICDLAPTIGLQGTKCTKGNVALIWPYSSSTEILSLLLVDPDVRLRKSKGQVKITFHGHCAREVADSKLGIGDNVEISLEGVIWSDTGDAVATPGRKIDWDLSYRKRAVLDIKRESVLLKSVDFRQTDDLSLPAGDQQSIPVSKPDLGNYVEASPIPFPSLGFLNGKRHTSGSFIDGSLDPFAEDDGFVFGKGRKKTKFARGSGSWLWQDEGSNVQPAAEHTILDDGIATAAKPTEVVVPSSPKRSCTTPSSDTQVELHASETFGANKALGAEVQHVSTEAQSETPGPVSHVSPSEISMSYSPIDAASTGQESDLRGDARDDWISAPQDAQMAPPDSFRKSPTELQESVESAAAKTPCLHPHSSSGVPPIPPLLRRNGLPTDYFHHNVGSISELETISAQIPETRHLSVPGDPQELPETLSMLPPSNFVDIDHGEHQTRNPTSPPQNYHSTATDIDLEGQEDKEEQTFAKILQRESYVAPIMPVPLYFGDPEDSLLNSLTVALPPTIDMTEGIETQDPDSNQNELKLLDEEHDEREHLHSATFVAPVHHPPSPRVTYRSAESHDSHGSASTQASYEPTTASPVPPRHWEDRLAITAIECASGEILASPPFPFRQRWDKGFKRRRSSGYSQGYDGVSDNEEELPSEDGLLDITKQEIRTVTDDAIPEAVLRDAEDTHSDDVPVSPADEAISNPVDVASRGLIVDQDSKIDEKPILEESIEVTGPPGVHVAATARLVPFTLPSRLDLQLLSPESTQQLTVSKDEVINLEEYRQEHPMPPTPPESQEPPESHLPPGVSGHPEQKPDTREISEQTERLSSSMAVANHRTLSRLSRKSLPLESISEISSPYFTPRRSMRMIQSQHSISLPRKENLPLATNNHPQFRLPPVKHLDEESVAIIHKDVSRPEKSRPAIARTSGFTSPLSHYLPLSVISDYYNQNIDVLAVCFSFESGNQRARSGPKDFYCTLALTDPSLTLNNVTIAQIFRPHKSAIPLSKQGDVILLRDFKVQSQNRKCILVSTDTSAWTVFQQSVRQSTSIVKLVAKSTGPPVEHGTEENAQALDLMQWWSEAGKERYLMPGVEVSQSEGLLHSSGAQTERSKSSSEEPACHPKTSRRRGNYTDNIGNDVNDIISPIADLSPPPATTARCRRQSDGSLLSMTSKHSGEPRSRINRRSRRSESVVHELRDGTKYTDNDDALLHELRDGATYVDE